MKITRSTIASLVLLVAALCLSTGCKRVLHAGVKGSGDRISEKRTLPAFTSITTEGAFDIEVVCQKEQSVQIEGDDNLLPLISTEVSGNTLRLRPTRNYSNDSMIVVKITIPNLDGFSVRGSGRMQIKGMKNDKFAIEASGASEIIASGETNALTIDASGAGKIDAYKLKANRATIEANGVAVINVNAREQLDVKINGPAHVSYEGDPEVNKSINGPGSLEKREGEGA